MDKSFLKEHQKIEYNIHLDYQNVGDLLSIKAKENHKEKFLFCPGKNNEQFTYSEFKAKVDQTSKFLIQSGLKKNDKISLIFHNSSEFLILYFAGLSCGITIVPINPDLAPNEIKYIIKDSDSKHVFYNYTLESKIDSIRENLTDIKLIKIESIDELTSASNNDVKIEQEKVSLSDVAVIIYTSGTTGNPKGVILNHLNLLSDAMSISEWFHFNKETRCLCILPLFHNNGQITTLLAPLFAGGSTIIVKGKISLFAFWDLVNEYKATWTSVMASILSILLSLPKERKDNSLSAILCGGQILTRSVQEQFESRFNIPIFEGYGLTETTSFSCINNFPAKKRKIGSIGKSLITNEMEILNENEEIIKNSEGEICIRGYNVANGYLGNIEKNHAFRNGWFHSGDYGKKDDEGNIYFHGRQDSLIIKGGENIYPAEIENILYNHPNIDECAVIGIQHELLGEEICAFVKIKEGIETNEKELRMYCKNKIADYKQPKKFIIINDLNDLDEIPKGPTKKILYRKLREYYEKNNV
ncbi:MAG: fatty acid--CoA ligase [Thaumarchaeota archaeon]|nr:MAG: fatty acid--CoA ligase [Nitrososphaerota archaeon]